MSADDATAPTSDHASDAAREPSGGDDSDRAEGSTPDHVEPYSSREDAAPRTDAVEIPDHVDPYASRDDEAPSTGPVDVPDHVEPYSSRD